MHRQIRKVGIGLVFAFLAVFLQLNYVQIFAAEEIASNNANVRALLREYSIKRGDIITLDGTRVAVSEPKKGQLRYRRTYPEGELYGHITGYYSIRYGTSRVESTFNDQLLGDSGVISMQDIQDRFLGSGEEGDDVRLTIHSRLQQTARDALGGERGAVIAMDPQTGEVRAMWNNPSYDPTPLASHDAKEARRYWQSLDPGSPRSALVPGVTHFGYPPGSTAKVITAAAALENGYSPDDTFEDPVELELPQTDQTLQNFTKTSCAGGQIDLFSALEISCDTTFAMLGMELPDEVRETAESMGFNDRLSFDVGTEVSAWPEVGEDNKPFQAFAAIGQGDVVATPLQMALVASSVANGGVTPRPQLVREVIDPSGGIVERFRPESLDQAMSTSTARELTKMMQAVVESGTGTAAQIPGLGVAGKTGTAQTVPGQNPHAWFIAFAPVADPQLAVAVIVENGGSAGSEATGGAVAAPIARALIEADRQIRGW